MGTTLTGTTPQDTYDSLIKVTDNGPLSGTAKYLSDGLGNDSALALSTANIGIGTTSPNLSGGASGSSILTISASASARNGILELNGTRTTLNDYVAYVRMFNNGAATPVADIAAIRGSSDTTGSLTLSTSNAERIRIDSSGNVGIRTSAPDVTLTLGTNTVTDNSIGIKLFRGASTNQYTEIKYSGNFVTNGIGNDLVMQRESTEVARFTTAGLCFNGDFAAANALDDYEEGTWTPVFAQGGTNNTATYSYQLGTYTKVGNLVTVFFDVEASSITAGSGACSLKGLPFTVGSSMAGYSCVGARAMSVFNGSLTNALATGFVEQSSTYIALQQVSTTTGQETSLSTYASSGRATGVVQYTV